MTPLYEKQTNFEYAQKVLPSTHRFVSEKDKIFGNDWIGYLFESEYDWIYKTRDRTNPLTRQFTPVQVEYAGTEFDIKKYPIFFAKPK